MKVLLIIPEYPPDYGGGIVTFYRDLVPALRTQGCTVHVLKGSAFVHGSQSYEHDGVIVSVLETERFHKWVRRFEHFSMFPELQRHLAASFALHEQAKEGEGVDAVEVTDWGFLFLPWVISAQAPVMVQLHGSTGQISHREPIAGREAEGAVALLLEKAALGIAPCLSSYSRANVRWWENVLGRNVHYLPPPLQLEAVAGDVRPSSATWLAAGRIQQWKGPQVACAAWELLGAHAPPLHWVGRDTFHGETGASTDAWLRSRFPGTWGTAIRAFGQVAPSEVARRMHTAKAILVPSTWDVFNLAAAEAMALGKPVVISDGAGAADLVDHGVNGFVFPSGDVHALANLVQHLQGLDACHLDAVGRHAATTVRDRLDPISIAKAKLALYRDLPKPGTRHIPWLREWLSPAIGRNPFGFLDSLPLKGIASYIMRRGAKKLLQGPWFP